MHKKVEIENKSMLFHISVYKNYSEIKTNITDETLCGIKNIIQNVGIYPHVCYRYFNTMYIKGTCTKCSEKLK